MEHLNTPLVDHHHHYNNSSSSLSPRGHIELSDFGDCHRGTYEPPVSQVMMRGNQDEEPTTTRTRMRSSSTRSRTQQNYSSSDRRNAYYHPHTVSPGEFMINNNNNNNNNSNVNNHGPALQDTAISCLSHGCFCIQCVRTQELGFTEQWGKFDEILGPGVHILAWPINTISGRLSLRIQQLNIDCRTIKTLDSVFCDIQVSVLYRVHILQCYQAYYRLQSIESTLSTIIRDLVISQVATMTLEDVFKNERKIANTVMEKVYLTVLREFGYEVIYTLLAKVEPDKDVKDSMNEINASKRLKQAAVHKAELHKIQTLKTAEAQAERMHLFGQGRAKERQAIVQGMKEVTNTWTTVDVRYAQPPTPQQVMDILLLSQYLDLLSSLQAENILIHHGLQANTIGAR